MIKIKYLSVFLLSYTHAKPGLISTLTADFFQEYKQDIMDIFEDTCQTVDLEPQKFTHDLDLFMLTLQLQN